MFRAIEFRGNDGSVEVRGKGLGYFLILVFYLCGCLQLLRIQGISNFGGGVCL